jgi:hypothetical protein
LDRREALKKIGVGGAAVAGASMVMSSPAFAYDGPTIVTQGTVQATVSPGGFQRLRTITLAVVGGNVTCPDSASAGAVGGPTFSSALTETTVPQRGLEARPGTSGPWTAFPTTVSGATFQIRGPALEDVAGATVSNTVTVTYTCTYANSLPTPPEVRSTSFQQTISITLV